MTSKPVFVTIAAFDTLDLNSLKES